MPATLEQSHSVKIAVFDTAQRYIEHKRFIITYQMFSLPEENDVLKQSKAQNSAYLKIGLFLNNHLDGSLAFTMEDMPMAGKFLSEYDNGFLVLPDLDDVTILEALHRKFTALAGEMTIITKLSLYDDDLNLKYNFYYEEEETKYTLPTIKDWVGDLSFWDVPWWDRYDVLTFDNFAQDEAERDAHRADVEARATTYAPLEQIDDDVEAMLKGIRKKVDEEQEEEVKQGELISLDAARNKKNKWKPTVI
jgi:hypothetical protein